MKFLDNLKIVFWIIALLWAIFFVNRFLPIDLRAYGIHPRRPDLWWGILLMPFLHGNFTHLTANSAALAGLLTVSLTYDRKLTLFAVVTITIVGGCGVFLLGSPNTVHIGASGVIFGLIGFLMFIGIFRREWKALFFSLIVCTLYGGALFSLFVYMPGISWSGHFFGFLAGVLAAYWTRTANNRKHQRQ